jgi:hydroxypyruvate isomerase
MNSMYGSVRETHLERKTMTMPKLSTNLGFLWPQLTLLDRIAAAHRAGFKHVEMHWPYDIDKMEIAAALAQYRLTNISINAPAGDRKSGEIGLGALRGREEEFLAGVDQAISYCLATGTRTIHALAGVPLSPDRHQARDVLIGNLLKAGQKAAEAGLTLVLEPLNQRNHPGYFYSSTAGVADLIDAVGLPNIRILLDVYHTQINEGDILDPLKRYFPLIHHVQIAAVPSRGEPDEGEVDYRAVFNALDELGYQGAVGCEYIPRGDTDEGLKRWTSKLGISLEG